MNLDKLPPQDISLEEAVLGAILIDSSAMGEIVSILTPEIFYKTEHSTIYNTMFSLHLAGQPIDLLTVSNELRKNKQLDNVGGAMGITILSTRLSSAANIESHSRLLIEMYLKRKIIAITARLNSMAYENNIDSFELIGEAENALFEITSKLTSKEPVKIDKAHYNLVNALKDKDTSLGVASGFRGLDMIIGSFKKGHLIIIAGRPGMGKTALINSLCKNISFKLKNPVLVFELEMTVQELTGRAVSDLTNINGLHIMNNNVTDAEYLRIAESMKDFKDVPVYIDDTPGISLLEIKSKARRSVKKYGVQLIIIDFIQLVTTHLKGTNRDVEIGYISRNLKALAKELSIPIIALSQLSREVEKRADKQPQLSDLRESGNIEQDADMVMFIYRPEYYTPDDPTLKGLAKFLIRKHRGGGLGDVEMLYDAEFTRFKDLNLYENIGQYQKPTNPF